MNTTPDGTPTIDDGPVDTKPVDIEPVNGKSIGDAPAPVERVTDHRIVAGIKAALIGQAVMLVPLFMLALAMAGDGPLGSELTFAVGGQVVLLVACLGAGFYHLFRGDNSLGRGLIIGWVLGQILAPMVLFVIVSLLTVFFDIPGQS